MGSGVRTLVLSIPDASTFPFSGLRDDKCPAWRHFTLQIPEGLLRHVEISRFLFLSERHNNPALHAKVQYRFTTYCRNIGTVPDMA